jgi:D-alanine-D-alanine ligase
MEKNSISEMEQDSDKPPSIKPQPARPWRVAVIANMKGETSLPFDGPADAGAEFDRKETIDAICDSIASDGHKSFFLPADNNLPYALRDLKPDICFNIAEGLGGDAREAQVPAQLEMLRIPYTASRVLANAIALDKTMTKRIWRDRGLPIAEFQEFVNGSEPLSAMLHFPLFAKPAREGTGMGVDAKAILHNMRELRQRVTWIIKEYQQPALVEEYLPGREFTIGVLGREDAHIFSRRPDLYRSDGFHRFNTLEVDAASNTVTPGIYGHTAKTLTNEDEGVPGFICPANVTRPLGEKLHRLAVAGHKAIGSLDVSRVDMRMDAFGQPKLIEINTLPGLTPGFSDLCVIANSEGITYRDLILEILYLGASRFKLLEPAAFGPFNMEALKTRKVRESVVVRN